MSDYGPALSRGINHCVVSIMRYFILSLIVILFILSIFSFTILFQSNHEQLPRALTVGKIYMIAGSGLVLSVLGFIAAFFYHHWGLKGVSFLTESNYQVLLNKLTD